MRLRYHASLLLVKPRKLKGVRLARRAAVGCQSSFPPAPPLDVTLLCSLLHATAGQVPAAIPRCAVLAGRSEPMQTSSAHPA